MSRFRCLTCLGEYEDVLPDGNLVYGLTEVGS